MTGLLKFLGDVLYFRPVEPLNPDPNEEVGGYILEKTMQILIIFMIP